MARKVKFEIELTLPEAGDVLPFEVFHSGGLKVDYDSSGYLRATPVPAHDVNSCFANTFGIPLRLNTKEQPRLVAGTPK